MGTANMVTQPSDSKKYADACEMFCTLLSENHKPYYREHGQNEAWYENLLRALQARLLGVDIPLNGDAALLDCIDREDITDTLQELAEDLYFADLGLFQGDVVATSTGSCWTDVTRDDLAAALLRDWDTFSVCLESEILEDEADMKDVDWKKRTDITEEEAVRLADICMPYFESAEAEIKEWLSNNLEEKGINPEYAESLMAKAYAIPNGEDIPTMVVRLPYGAELPDGKELRTTRTTQYKGMTQIILFDDDSEAYSWEFVSDVFRICAMSLQMGIPLKTGKEEK